MNSKTNYKYFERLCHIFLKRTTSHHIYIWHMTHSKTVILTCKITVVAESMDSKMINNNRLIY